MMLRTDAFAIVALGSNLGDSRQIIAAAMKELVPFSSGEFRRSSLWRSTPVDCPPGSLDFINAAVAFVPQPEESPESLLGKLQEIERKFGRRPKAVLNEARPLDLDLIVFRGEVRNQSELALPHPRAHRRKFVLNPIAEIAADLILPGQTQTIRELLGALQSAEVVERL